MSDEEKLRIQVQNYMREGSALSVRQPWASMIMWGLKTVEVRSWSTDYRGNLFIHAAKRVDDRAADLFQLEELPIGCLLGTVELLDVERLTCERWKELGTEHLQPGEYQPDLFAWHFGNPKPLANPIQYQGELGLFHVSIDDVILE